LKFFHIKINKSQLNLLLALTDLKDSYTALHSTHVQQLSLLIYKNIDKSVKRKINRNNLKKSSLFHDVGKVYTPSDILLKNGNLTDSEFEEMKKHTLVGEKIMKRTNNKNIAMHVLFHHERYDSNGYWGLNEQDTTIEAKIITCADCFSAMVSNRPYKKAMNINDAIDEIKKLSGSQFDPVVVEAFLKINSKELIKLNSMLR